MPGSSSSSKFAGFSRIDRTYATVSDHDLRASIFTSKRSSQKDESTLPQTGKPVPVVVFWHGGGFVVGDRLYEPWWPSWLLELCLAQSAMIVAPDYRLLPEASGADIMDDLDEFWKWFLHTVPGVAESEGWPIRPDLHRILCVGHSAGGSLALLSALEHPNHVKAVTSLYGALDDSVPELKLSRPRMVLGSWPPQPRQAESIIRTYQQRTKGTVRTSGDAVEMWELVTCILQQGRLPRMMHRRPDPRLNILARVQETRKMPPIWMIHGENDSVVPVSCTTEFIKRVNAIVPDVPKRVSIRPGEHNFDALLSLQEAWVSEGCEFLKNHW